MYFHFFFFNDTATTEIYTLSLHDALPICVGGGDQSPVRRHGNRAPGDGCLRGDDDCSRPVLSADRRGAPAHAAQADHPHPRVRLPPLAETTPLSHQSPPAGAVG